MERINLTSDIVSKLDSPIAFDDAVLIGSNAMEEPGYQRAGLMIIPFNEIISIEQGEHIDELVDDGGIPMEGAMKVNVKNTEGEQTYYLYDFVVIAAHQGHITL